MASAFLRITLGRSLSRRLTLAVSSRNDPIIAALSQRHLHRNHPLLATMVLEMPSLSPTMSEGTIVKWHKKEGDSIAPGDVLCDIQTDKAVVSMDTEEEGILAKIIMPENSKDVKIGTLIALMVEEGDDWQSATVPGAEAAPAPAAPAPSAPTSAPAAEPFRGLKITMPSLSPTMTEGVIIKWHKKEGDIIAPGDLLCDIQTDKAVVSMDVEEEGILAKILMPEGSKDVKIGHLIALIVEEGEDWQNVTIPTDGAEDSAPPPAAAAPSPTPPVSPQAAPAAEAASKADIEEIHSLTGVGPSVKKLLEEYLISPNEIKPTGPKGHLLKGDVLSVIKSKSLHKVDMAHPPVAAAKATVPAVAPAAPVRTPSKPLPAPTAAAAFIDIPTTNMRKVIAKRLTESKTTIPHSYGSVDCNVGNAVKLRKQLIATGVKISMNDFIIKAAALALQRVPQMNATLHGDTPVMSDNVDISIAVATPNGLITPIVQNAAKLGVAEISSKVKELAGRAREGKLQLHEFQGGSFSISNLGMFGVTEFTAVINPPQAAILAIGTSRRIPGIAGPLTMMTVTLSYDRRAVDEHEAAKFLGVFQEIMEKPNILISGMAPPSVTPQLPNTPPPAPSPVPATSESRDRNVSDLSVSDSMAREAFLKSLMT